MSGSKLCLNATVRRSRKVFSARIKEKGPILGFWFELGMIDWLEAIPDKDTFNKFYLAFQSLTYVEPYRIAKAELNGFSVKLAPGVILKLVVELTKDKKAYVFRLLNSQGHEIFDMDIRGDEARNIFFAIYEYFLT